MENKPKGNPLMQQAIPTLTYSGHSYDLNKVAALGKQGPLITINKDQLTDPKDNQFPEVAVTYENYDTATKCEVVITKQLGKYTVLVGKAKVDELLSKGQTELKARLISHPSLKRARIT